MPFSDKSPLNTPFKFRQRIIRKGNKDYFVVIGEDTERQIQEVETFLKLPSEEEKNKYLRQRWYTWTVKDFGRFKRFINDRRIPNLSGYFENKEVSFEFIKFQLKEYDKYREKIFQETFELEKKISENHLDEIVSIEMERRKNGEKTFFDVQFNVYEEFLRRKGILSEDEIKSLVHIRNNFSHSEFPNNVFQTNLFTKENVEAFDQARLEKGKVEGLNLSISKNIYEKYIKICYKAV